MLHNLQRSHHVLLIRDLKLGRWGIFILLKVVVTGKTVGGLELLELGRGRGMSSMRVRGNLPLVRDAHTKLWIHRTFHHLFGS